MSNNNLPASNGLGVPGSGFASRGKGMNIKRLSFDTNVPPQPVEAGAPTPRTSRSHLLAGLRTVPKSATSGTFPQSAAAAPSQRLGGAENSLYADMTPRGPKTSTGAGFPSRHDGYASVLDETRQVYAHPEPVLAPPAIHLDEHDVHERVDPNIYNQLLATSAYLAEQQQILQQRLMLSQAAAQQSAQQFKMSHGGQLQQQLYLQQHVATPPYTPKIYHQQQQQQQVQASMQPIVSPVLGQPGVYAVFDPISGQQAYFLDRNAQTHVMEATSSYYDSPPPAYGTPRVQISPPTCNAAPVQPRSSSSPPPKKSNSPPPEVSPLPPPSATAFRRGHNKSGSSANSMSSLSTTEGARSNPKASGFPATPMNGSFGPGQHRAGEHPVRQPRGPPPLDELVSTPTTKHEGSKNFATRQRRDAVKNLSRSLLERRRAPGSVGSMTPVSEAGEMILSIPDHDSDSERSGSLSGRPTPGSSRTSFHGAIGSDRPSSRQKQREQSSERMSVESHYTTASISSDEETANGGSFAAVFKNGGRKTPVMRASHQPRKSPMLVLTTSAAEKRKTVY